MATGWRSQYSRYQGFFLDIVNLYNKRADLRAFLEVILSISTVTIFLIFAFRPTALTIISLTKEIKEKKAKIVLMDNKLKDLKLATEVFNQNESSIQNINLSMPNTPNPDIVTKQILALSEKNSVNLLGVSIGQVVLIGTTPVKKSNLNIKSLPGDALGMPVSISFKGNYQNILSFIKDLENSKIPVRIDSLGVNSTSNNENRVIVSAVDGRVPYLGNK